MLKDILQQTKAQAQIKMPKEVMESFEQLTQELKESSLLEKAPKVGDLLPLFSLPNAMGKRISSDDYRQKGQSLILCFYRGGWCPYCNLELKAYQNLLQDIHEKGAEFIAISPELPDTSLSLVEKQELKFEVLSDVDNAYAKKLGLVFELNEKVKAIYKKSATDFQKTQGNERYELPVPATLVVNPKGEIVYIFADVDYTKRAEPMEVLSYL